MVTNHIPRLLRLARRTGDRLIVTDEQGGGEPMVILPLEEYEALIDQAFGPSSFLDESDRDEQNSTISEPVRQEQPIIAQESEAVAGVTIELDSAELLGGDDAEEAFDDEAEIDETALIDLWKVPTMERMAAEKAAREAELLQNAKEVEQKPVVRAEGGEEQFYLEPID